MSFNSESKTIEFYGIALRTIFAFKMQAFPCAILFAALLSQSDLVWANSGEGCRILFRSQLPTMFTEARTTVAMPLVSSYENKIILARVQKDSSLRVFPDRMRELLAGSTELGKALRDDKSPESQFFLSFMRWLAYRSEKPQVSEGDNIRLAELDSALQKTNIIEIYDQLVLHLLRDGNRIPEPMLRLMTELLHSGVERIQTAADTMMLNGEIGNLVTVQKDLQKGKPISQKALWLAIMKLWCLDGGAPYAIQRTQSQLNLEERSFFAALDPYSPLALLWRDFSTMEVDQIRHFYRGIPFIQLTAEQIVRALAADEKYRLSSAVSERVLQRFPGRTFTSLTFEELESALDALGERNLTQRARDSVYLGSRVRSAMAGVPAAALETLARQTRDLALRPASGLVTLPSDQEALHNVATQNRSLALSKIKIDGLMAKMSPAQPGYRQKLEVYRSFLNLSLYAPHRLARSRGLFGSLAVVIVEFGSEADCTRYLKLLHFNFESVFDPIFREKFKADKAAYLDLVQRFLNVVESRDLWNEQTMRFVLDKAELLSGLQSSNELNSARIQSVASEIQDFRRAEDIDVREFKRRLAQPKLGSGYINFGVLKFEIEVRVESALHFKGATVRIKNLTLNHGGWSEFAFDLGRLESFLKSQGIFAYEIFEPTLHLMRAFSEDRSFLRVNSNTNNRDPFIFVKHFQEQVAPVDLEKLKNALKQIRVEQEILTGVFSISFKRSDVNTLSKERGSTLILQQVFPTQEPGTGLLAPTLRIIENAAREAGFVMMVIEGIDNPRQWPFYEGKMKYARHPRYSESYRSYYIGLK